MARYHRSEAREWAREHLVGVANVTIPTMTSDFTCLNEKAIRHDVNLTIEHGFVGSLAVSEVPLSFEEHDQFQQLMVDEAKGRLIVVHHAVFNTLEDNIAAVKRAEANGAELVLLGYPPLLSEVLRRGVPVQQGHVRRHQPGRHAVPGSHLGLQPTSPRRHPCSSAAPPGG